MSDYWVGFFAGVLAALPIIVEAYCWGRKHRDAAFYEDVTK